MPNPRLIYLLLHVFGKSATPYCAGLRTGIGEARMTPEGVL